MSTNWVRTGFVSLIACLAMGACDDNPVSEGRGDATSLGVNPEFAVVNAADTTRVYVVAYDRYGQLTYGGVQFTACDNKIALAEDPERVGIEAPERTLVLGETLGESCVTASGPGGLSVTATVQVVPAKVEATLPAVIGSGASVAADLVFLDKAGNPVTGFTAADLSFSLSDDAVADVDADGNVTGKAPGDATLDVTLASKWEATRTASADFTVEPGTFDGTVAPAQGNWGTTFTVSAGAVPFDDDSHVEFDGLTPYLISQDASSIVVVGPAGMGGSPSNVTVLDVGPNQLAYATTIEVPDPTPNDADEPNDSPAEAVPVSFPFEGYRSVGNLDIDDFLQITLATATTVSFYMDWNYTDADLDILIYDSNGDLTSNYDCATGAVPETCSFDLAAGVWNIDIDVYDGGGHDWVTTFVQIQ